MDQMKETSLLWAYWFMDEFYFPGVAPACVTQIWFLGTGPARQLFGRWRPFYLSGINGRKGRLVACCHRHQSTRRPDLPLTRSAVSGGNAPVTGRSFENWVERQLLHLANSHTRPVAASRYPEFGSRKRTFVVEICQIWSDIPI